MKTALLDHIHSKFTQKRPVVRTGQTVRVHQKIKEGGKERVQIFEGLVIKTNAGRGLDSTFTVRKVMGGIGVEKVFPLHSANIKQIEITGSSKVRRSKLYYMRDRTGKSARLREGTVREEDLVVEEDIVEEAPAKEESKEDAKPEKTEEAKDAPAQPEAAEQPAENDAPAEEAPAKEESKAEEVKEALAEAEADKKE